MIKLQTRNISKNYDNVPIIEDINIIVKEKEMVSLLGASGIGKTTLFNILSGIEAPTSGEVIFNSEDITGKTGHVSYMQQKDLLLPFKTIIENVSLPLVIKGHPKKEAEEEAVQYFETFQLKGYEKKYPSQLSGGMRQRAALLRTYLFSKEVMLLDEPFSALDPLTKSHIHKWYLEVMEKVKSSTLFITHDIDEAIFLSDRIYILAGKPGRVIKELIIEDQRPRNKEFTTSSMFMNYKKEILSYII